MRKLIVSALLMLCFLPAMAQGRHQSLPQDAAVRKGILPNGMTYYIRHNDQTPNVAEFYIAQRVGSILEEPRQRGLAHFLEHMAFNGTKNFPGAERGGLREWCESVGIKFGANLNAYTSVDQTVYNISSAPVSKAGVVDTCLLILHDWSHFLLLRDDEIDKERGVIHEEWRTRRAGMAVQRLMEEATPVIYKGTKYEDCLPIGSMDVVDHFSYDALRDYYNKWYRPDLQAVIVVGDIDVAQIEKKIRSTFSDIPAAPANAARRIYYPVSDNQHMIVFARADKEQPTCNFTLYMKREATPRADKGTLSYYRDGYLSSLVTGMLTDRLHDLAQLPEPPFMSASVRDGSFFVSSTKDAFSLSSTLKLDNVRGGIQTAIGALERARQHGFTQSELDRAKAEELRIAENRYNNRTKTRNRHYVNVCVRNFLDNEPMLSEEAELTLVRQLGQSVTLDDVNRMVREMITDRNQVVTFYTPDKNGFRLPSDLDIESWVYAAQQQSYEPFEDRPVRTQLLDREPQPGTIVSETDATNGYRAFTLSNGMHVYVRPTDFDADRVQMRIFSLGGQSLYPDADDASLSYLASTIAASGIGSFSATELEKALAGKTVRVQPFVGTETEGLQGSSNARDLETLLQLTHLYFTAPRRDDNAFNGLIAKQQSFLTNRDANPRVAFNDSVTAILYGNHPRMQPMKRERLRDVSLDRIMQVYGERFANAGDFSVILTGSLDLDQLRPLMERYLASLPATDAREQVVDRHIDIRPVDEVHVFRRQQTTPTATTNIFITAPMPYDALNDLRLSVLCQLMRMVYTEKVREEKGGTYGVSVQGSLSKGITADKDEALMKIEFRTDPDKYDELIPIIYEQLQLMAQQGPAEADLQKVKEYEVKTYDQNAVTNDYWDYVKYHELREGVDFDKDYKQLVRSLTTESIRQFCQQLLQPQHRIQVTMLPE